MDEKREVWWRKRTPNFSMTELYTNDAVANGKASVSGSGITEDCGLYVDSSAMLGFETNSVQRVPSGSVGIFFFVDSTYLCTLSFATRPVYVTLPSHEIFSVL
ncbi:uncharacterized protein RSE6_01701 [Rhynchosporium secalis]|uniref:Uncharacterized protein n=1 Tax=Rhynchosporium secalis TaxID=38038 RepID=A0A1E1LYF6_RHYSE|nr:uncharacterized protein RSE6_01701 [Rhynchosporium secalis]